MRSKEADGAARRLLVSVKILQGHYGRLLTQNEGNNCPHTRRLRHVANEAEKFSTQVCGVFTRTHKHASVSQIVS